MPEIRPAPQLPSVDMERESFVTSVQALKQAYALTLVTQTFFQYETFRQQNHDRRWTSNDALYLGWLPQRNWEGSTVPRASLPAPIVFDQVETALPAILQALFSMPEWFQVEADAGGSTADARNVSEHLLYLFEHDKDGFGLTAQNDVELAIKSGLIWGNGGLSLEWDAAGQRPAISWVDLRDFYIDPGTSVPSVDYARSVIRRSLKTVEEIMAWRSNPAMNIPSDEILWGMANKAPVSMGDQVKQMQAALLGVNFTPGASDLIPNPTDRKIEVLAYYSRTRIVVVLNREWVAFVGDNPYGFIPFCFFPTYIVPGRWYAQSIADVQESNQRYIEALLNGRLDELTLALHPPRIMKSSTRLTPSQQRWRPGQIIQTANPKEDVQFFEPAGATTNVYSEIEYIERMSEKRTGISSLGMGLPRPSNANRTAAGMQMQMSGGQTRLMLLVKHIEDYLLVPLLYKMYRMIRVHTQYGAQLPAKNGGQVPASSFMTPVKFRILGSTQMMTKEKLLSVLPVIMQFVVQGPLMQQLSATGRTIDFDELLRMIQDATGIGKLYTIVRPLNEQEQQQLNQPSPAEQMQAQQQQQAAQQEMQIAQEKNQTTLQVAAMKQQEDPMKAQFEQQKLQMEMAAKEMELYFEQEKMKMEREAAQMKLQIERAKMDLAAQKGQLEMILSQQKAQSGMQVQEMQTQQKIRQTEIQGSLAEQQAVRDQELAQTQHDQNLRMSKEKADFQAQQLRAKPGAGKPQPDAKREKSKRSE